MRVSFGAGGPPLQTAEAVKRRLMEMSREQGNTKSTATIYKVGHPSIMRGDKVEGLGTCGGRGLRQQENGNSGGGQ